VLPVGKVIFALLTALIAWILFKGFTKKVSRSDDASVKPKPASEPPKLTERMVKCATCGVFMPESESVLLDGVVSCKDPAHCAHRR
jgi:hypothetical protein